MRHFNWEAKALRFLAVRAAVQNTFRLARHRLKAIHHRLRREQALNTWKLAPSFGREEVRATMHG